MHDQILRDFTDLLSHGYNIEHEDGQGWFHFSKGRGVYQGGLRGEQFRIALSLFEVDPTSREYLDKDLKKVSRSLGDCFLEEERGTVWIVASVPLAEATQATMRLMFEDCLQANRSKTLRSLEAQHRKTPTINKPR